MNTRAFFVALVPLTLAAVACGGSDDGETGDGGAGGSSAAGSSAAGSAGKGASGSSTAGTAGASAGSAGSSTAGTAGSGTAGTGTAGTGTAGTGTAGSGTAGSGTAGTSTAGSAGKGTAGTGTAGTGTAGTGTAGTGTAGGGTAGSGTAGAAGVGSNTKCTTTAECPPTEYCDFSDELCGTSPYIGHCKTRPVGCSDVFAPVCGCDGKVYGNACDAKAAGVDLADKGTCAPPNDTLFACGSHYCKLASEYCQHTPTDVPSIPDDWYCMPLPPVCGGTPDCTCLEKTPCGMFSCSGDAKTGLRTECPGGG